MKRPLVEVVDVRRRNGAWLVSLNDTFDNTEGVTPADSFDAAATLRRAKQVAEEMAAGYEFTGLRWRKDFDCSPWALVGYEPEPEGEVQ